MVDIDRQNQLTLQETAQLEIGVRQTRDEEHAQLDQEWKKERDKMAQKPVAEPSLDLGSNLPRSLQEEYTERRAFQDQKHERVETRYQNIKQSIRASGKTLSSEFNQSKTVSVVPHQHKADTTKERHTQINPMQRAAARQSPERAPNEQSTSRSR